MTLLDDICEVHDGVLKAPPLVPYWDKSIIMMHATRLVNEIENTSEDDEVVYSHAKILAIEAVRIMQLASKNIEKEQCEIKQEAKKEPDYVFEVGLVLGTVRKK